MRIKLYVVDVDTDEVLEEIGTCLTDSPNRAVQNYNEDEAWAEKGYNADIRWEDITDKAAAELGRKGGSANTPAQNVARAANGSAPVKAGSNPRGRPRKTK